MVTAAIAPIAYVARTGFRQCYYANDHSRDTVVVAPQPMPLHDGRAAAPTLDGAGFALVRHASAVSDFTDKEQTGTTYAAEIVALLKQQTGADEVRVTGPGVVRFSEASARAGTLDNSMPARFVHVDTSVETAAQFAAGAAPEGRAVARYAHFNVWRCFSGAPQDVPLALCDARTVSADDLIPADALFDVDGEVRWQFESYIVAHNAAHRWHWFADMTPDEAILFKTSDSALGNIVPHVAFDNALAPADCHPRASIEMRAVAYWFA